ncbi:RNA polymerase sigma factor [Gelidibacter salicanalis]|uniref:Sigma-70 family RNA polymerase sigma factor n=1 Tax=Gelidibacter salicanalis TaxID=291193 RepID=A0A934NJJ8_9FLAO|nr:sigma-70 family RNA polymerase sigma factor [Gelidibacter salicanalis]MBJ7881504.1 sigma-70 family RNA polymerase sigma factor [Gelidibacter salicanalis]
MEHQFADALKHNDDQLVKELYVCYREEFIRFSKKYQIAPQDSVDIYQDAFLSIRKHALSGKLYEVNSSFKTYLFGIGKHLIFNKLKDYASKKPYDPKLHHPCTEYEIIRINDTQEPSEEQKLLRHYFNQLGKSCQQMLTLSFYRGLTNEEIAKQYGYDSEAVVRSQKSRCLKTLKNLIKQSPR